MAKRKTTRARKREEKKRRKMAGIGKPSGQSKYGKKNRQKEIGPFYLPESQR